MVSLEPGNPEPLYMKLKTEQVHSECGKQFIRWLRNSKMPDKEQGWVWSYTITEFKWHQIDNFGEVCYPCPFIRLSSI